MAAPEIDGAWLRNAWASFLVGLATFVGLFVTLDGYGYAIDEASYLWVAREERLWFSRLDERPLSESFSREELRQGFHFLEPPGERGGHSNFNLPLAMHLANVGWLLTGGVDELFGCRLASMVLFALAAAMTQRVLTRMFDVWIGLVGAIFLVALPRAFGHAHLAATETTLSSFWLLTLLVCLEGRVTGRIRPFCLGLMLALTMSVKLSGWYLAPVVGSWLLFTRPAGWKRGLAWSVLLPIPMMVALTPTLWHDPVGGLWDYIAQARENPWQIATYYLGEGYLGGLPLASGPLTLFVTMPVATIGIGLAGLFFCGKNASWWLTVASALVVLGARMMGLLPGHDGERHMAPAMYSMALASGIVLGVMTCRWQRSGRMRYARLLVLCLVVLEPVSEVIRYREHGLMYYNRAVGGLRGANSLGLEVSYWFEGMTFRDWSRVMERLPEGAKVFLRPDHPGLEDLKRMGVWRADVISTGPEEADYFLLYAKRAAYFLPVEGKETMTPTDLGLMAEREEMDFERRFDGVRIWGLKRAR